MLPPPGSGLSYPEGINEHTGSWCHCAQPEAGTCFLVWSFSFSSASQTAQVNEPFPRPAPQQLSGTPRLEEATERPNSLQLKSSNLQIHAQSAPCLL